MVFWTIQHKRVVESVKEKGSYYPDFSLSPRAHRETYQRLIDVYNAVNQTAYNGLIFCIEKDARQEGHSLSFKDEKDFSIYMKKRPGVINALNNGAFTLFDGDHLLCKIETDKFDDMCPCRVDFWNFVFMMPEDADRTIDLYESCMATNPAFTGLPYNEFVSQSWSAMERRGILHPLMKSTVFQSHIPYIEADMLKGVYCLSELMA